jgi:hypothetical protein
MAKLILKFKEKHLCICTQILKQMAAADSFETLYEFKSKLRGAGLQPNDEVVVEVPGNVVLAIYDGLGQLPERLANAYNSEIAELLTPQIVTLSSGTDEVGTEAKIVLEGLSKLRERNFAMQKFYETEGRNWINQ